MTRPHCQPQPPPPSTLHAAPSPENKFILGALGLAKKSKYMHTTRAQLRPEKYYSAMCANPVSSPQYTVWSNI